jgi:hypothetical protein
MLSLTHATNDGSSEVRNTAVVLKTHLPLHSATYWVDVPSRDVGSHVDDNSERQTWTIQGNTPGHTPRHTRSPKAHWKAGVYIHGMLIDEPTPHMTCDVVLTQAVSRAMLKLTYKQTAGCCMFDSPCPCCDTFKA